MSHRLCDTRRQEVHKQIECCEKLIRGGDETLIDCSDKESKTWGLESVRVRNDKRYKEMSSVMIQFSQSLWQLYETRRKRWVGGSLQKDIQETVNFLVCQKLLFSLLLVFYSLLLSPPLLYIITHHAGKMQHFYLAQQCIITVIGQFSSKKVNSKLHIHITLNDFRFSSHSFLHLTMTFKS